AGLADLLGDLDKVRPNGGEVAGHTNVQRLRLAAVEIKQVQGAELFVDDGTGAGRGRLDVQTPVFDELAHFLGGRVVGKQANRSLAIGEEVDLGFAPHRVEVVGVVAGYLRNVGIAQVGDPDGRSGAATVALPGHVELRIGDEAAVGVGHVGEPTAVGG